MCKYIGINKQEVKPEIIKKIGNKLLVINTESYKRHTYTQKLDQFLSRNIEKLDDHAKKKLGVSLGKILAKNIIVSFEKTTIK